MSGTSGKSREEKWQVPPGGPLHRVPYQAEEEKLSLERSPPGEIDRVLIEAGGLSEQRLTLTRGVKTADLPAFIKNSGELSIALSADYSILMEGNTLWKSLSLEVHLQRL